MSDLEHDDTTLCAADKCTRPAAPGAVLCQPDVRRLGDWLAQIGTEYELLSAAPSMQGREVGTIGGGTLASQRSPGLTHVMALRDGRRGLMRWASADDDDLKAFDAVGLDDTPSVFDTLHTYADQVRAPAADGGRGIAAARARLTVASERKLLAAHFDWITAQDWAGEFHDELRRLYAVLRAANGHAAPTTRMRRLHVPCTACGVRAITHRPGDGQACCENCGTCTVLEEERISA